MLKATASSQMKQMCHYSCMIIVSVFSALVLTPAHAAGSDACTYLERAANVEPRGAEFLSSYPTVPNGPLHSAAYLYDNSVAAIALISCGASDQAFRIGDALLAALNRDRYWHDGRLRNAYLAGTVGPGAVKLPGEWDARQGRWIEDAYQVSSDSGNAAWAILALLTLDRQATDHRYRDGAIRIGHWLAQWQSQRPPGGFTGGTFGEEPQPTIEPWRSTEHAVDLTAAFLSLYSNTGDRVWITRAKAAEKFVHAMWNPRCRCFAAGTVAAGAKRNRYIAIDAQVLPLLGVPGATTSYRAAFNTALRMGHAGLGLPFGEVGGGIWTEGTYQAALLADGLGENAVVDKLVAATSPVRLSNGGYLATNVKSLSTGLTLDTDQTQMRTYFPIEHLAPAAWAALLEHHYNPLAVPPR